MRRVLPQSFPEEILLETPDVLGRSIRAARTQSGLTLAEAALANGISTQTMQRLETDPATVGFGLLLQVARMMGVSLFAVPAASQNLAHKTLKAAIQVVNEAQSNHAA